MKVRKNFVSNSSSSSFLLLGKTYEDWVDILKCPNPERLMVIVYEGGTSGSCGDDVFPLKKEYRKTIKKLFEENNYSIVIMDVQQEINRENDSTKIGHLTEELELVAVEKDYNCSQNINDVNSRYLR